MNRHSSSQVLFSGTALDSIAGVGAIEFGPYEALIGWATKKNLKEWETENGKSQRNHLGVRVDTATVYEVSGRSLSAMLAKPDSGVD
jgi:hypothetical protein